MPNSPLTNPVVESNDKNRVEEDHSPQNDDCEYPRGVRFAFLTIGLMAVVLMVALDNYIIGLICFDPHCKCSVAPAEMYRNRDSSNHGQVRRSEFDRLVWQLLFPDTHGVPAGVRSTLHSIFREVGMPHLSCGVRDGFGR